MVTQTFEQEHKGRSLTAWPGQHCTVISPDWSHTSPTMANAYWGTLSMHIRNLVSACQKPAQNHQVASERVTLSCKDTHGCSWDPGGKKSGRAYHRLSEL